MDRGLRLYDKFLASSRIYDSIEALEMTGKCLEFMNKHRRKYRFTEKMIVKEERRIKQFNYELRITNYRKLKSFNS